MAAATHDTQWADEDNDPLWESLGKEKQANVVIEAFLTYKLLWIQHKRHSSTAKLCDTCECGGIW